MTGLCEKVGKRLSFHALALRRRHSERPNAESLAALNSRHAAMTTKSIIRYCVSSLFGVAALAGVTLSDAKAQDPILEPGDAIVTGFSGLTNSPTPAPLDGFFIDPEGPSMQILPIGINEKPAGQHLNTAAKFSVKASEVGQVFPITLQSPLDALPNTPPNIFLGASSAFGLQIVKPDEDGDGIPDRLKKGHANAEWMEGQFGAALGGEPGSIYRVDGTTGEVTLFTTIPGNAGPGLGDVVFDSNSRQFFVSDLDTGLIHRLSEDGVMIDSFDHGADGRTAAGLPAVADDGAQLDITNPAFDIENSDTWGLTQTERRIWGMAVNGGRLYYSVWDGPQIWSVGINEDGSFAADARKEFDVEAAPKAYPISDMVFDGAGRLYLAQRGGLQSSYDYTVFAKAKESNVLRYVRKQDGTWATPPESYAIGFPEDHKNASGGIDLGLSLQRFEGGRGACDASVWSTGDALRNVPELQEPRVVHGLQGNETALVRPQNVPPENSVFADYDGKFNDPQAEGHVGDVEIWQPCESRPTYGEYVPPAEPPYDVPWGDDTPEGDPDFNLTLEKYADPKECFEQFGGWMCWYTITVTNTGSNDFVGPITVRDWVPAAPPGTWMDFHVQPVPWTCNPPTPGLGSDFECTHDPVLLTPGDSVELYVDLWLPATYPDKGNNCRIRNNARIVWPFGFGDMNMADDIDTAVSFIPSDRCDDLPPKKSDLILKKIAVPNCAIVAGKVRCAFLIDVLNAGLADYNGDIIVKDTLPAGANMILAGPNPPWNCNLATGECKWTAASLPAGSNQGLVVIAEMSVADAKNNACQMKNTAKITKAPGGSPSNFDPTNDEDSATAFAPPQICEHDIPIDTNLKIVKEPADVECLIPAGKDWCTVWDITVTNTGPGVFHDFVEIEDNAPAGINISLSGAGWTCLGNKCKTNAPEVLNPNPPSGDKLTVRAFLTGSRHLAQDLGCQIENQAHINSPLGAPKNTNPGDDKDTAMQALPADLCGSTVPNDSNLRLKKTASPEQCAQVPDGWKCSWTIEVHNDGPAPFNGPVEINETLPGEPVSGTWSPGWNCAGVGGGGGAICKHPATGINVGGFLTLNLDMVFSNDLVRANQCQLINLAEIAKPTGGTSQNTNPADDTDQATAYVPADFCEKEPPRCPPGYETVPGAGCVPITDSCPTGWSKTPVKGKCCPPGKGWNGEFCGTGVTVTPIPPADPDPVPSCPAPWKLFNAYSSIPKGWQVYVVDGINGTSWYCAKPRPKPEVECPDGWREIRSSDRSRFKAAGWTVLSRGKGKARIWCGLPPKQPPLQCDAGYRNIPQTAVQSYRKKGWTVLTKRRGIKVIWCAKPGKTDTQCKRGEVLSKGECVCKSGTHRSSTGECVPNTVGGGSLSCPSGYQSFPTANRIPKGWLRRIIRKNGKVVYCGKKPNVTGGGSLSCPSGYQKFPTANRIPKGWLRRTIRKNGKVIFCGKKQVIRVPQQTCAQKGMIGKWPNCRKRPVIKPRQSCAQKGMLGKWPNCYKKPNRLKNPQLRLPAKPSRPIIKKPNRLN